MRRTKLLQRSRPITGDTKRGRALRGKSKKPVLMPSGFILCLVDLLKESADKQNLYLFRQNVHLFLAASLGFQATLP